MSTKICLKFREATTSSPGYHLYEDAMDDFDGTCADETPVYLQLDKVSMLTTSFTGGELTVTLGLPRALARELGLL